MKELTNHPFMDNRTVKAWETTSGGYVQVYDVRDLMHGEYSVEVKVQGGMKSIWSSSSLERVLTYAKNYAEVH